MIDPDSEPNSKSSTTLTSLAALYQEWSELCSSRAKREPTLALKWYLKGMASAHGIDAERAREMTHPSVILSPPEGDPFAEAYRGVLKLMSGFARTNGEKGDDD